MTKRIGIIGYPLSHTLSPMFHQAGFDHLGIDAKFGAWPTPPDELEARIDSFREADCIGACVTLPHKQAVMAMMDGLDDTARTIGAMNWLTNRDGVLTGYNTDAAGFLRALREEAEFEPEGCSAVLFGAGGAARAMAFGLRDAGAKRLTIANRTVSKGQALASDLRQGRFRPEAIGLTKDELADTVPYADLLANATSIGMSGGPASAETPVTADLVPSGVLAYDAVYAPPMTPFLREVERAGGRVATGLSMLVYQGVIGFELCTGRTAPVSVMMDAVEKATRA